MSSKWNDCSALLCSALRVYEFCMEWNRLLDSVKCITVLRINKRYLLLSKPVRLPASTHPTIVIAMNIHINSFGSMYQTRQYICTWWTDGKSYAQCEQKKPNDNRTYKKLHIFEWGNTVNPNYCEPTTTAISNVHRLQTAPSFRAKLYVSSLNFIMFDRKLVMHNATHFFHSLSLSDSPSLLFWIVQRMCSFARAQNYNNSI